MIAIFELGSLAFWLLLVVAFIVVVAAQEIAEYPGSWSTFWVILTFLIIYFCGSKVEVNQFGLYILYNPLRAVVYFLLYTLAGTLWSFYKWREVVARCARKYNAQIEKYKETLKMYPNSGISKAAAAPSVDDYRPELKDHKAEIFNWIFYWPFSFTWFLVHEPIERLFRFIMKHTKKVYEGITDRAFAKVQPKENETKLPS